MKRTTFILKCFIQFTCTNLEGSQKEGDNFFNLLQKEGGTQKGGGFPQKGGEGGGGGSNPRGNYDGYTREWKFFFYLGLKSFPKSFVRSQSKTHYWYKENTGLKWINWCLLFGCGSSWKLMGVYTKSTVFQYSTCLQKTYLIYVHKQWFFRGFIVIFVGFEKHLLIWQAAVSFGNLFSLYMLNKVVLTQCKITLNRFAEWVENINMTNVCIC